MMWHYRSSLPPLESGRCCSPPWARAERFGDFLVRHLEAGVVVFRLRHFLEGVEAGLGAALHAIVAHMVDVEIGIELLRGTHHAGGLGGCALGVADIVALGRTCN